MRKKMQEICPLLVLGLCLGALLYFHIASPAGAGADTPIKNGKLALSGWDGSSILSLSGNWDFYWNRFLNEADLAKNPLPDYEAPVPSVWNGYVIHGKSLGGTGYATYRLHVTGAKAGQPLSMRVLPFLTAYDLYIGQQEVASSGAVSTSPGGYFPQYRVQTFVFTPQSSEFDIILHVANFVYARGGACYTIYFSSPTAIHHLTQSIFAKDILMMGCLLIILLFTLFLFYLRRDKTLLLLSALCLLMFGRTLIDGEYFINLFFPGIWFAGIIWIDYITLYWIPALFLWLSRCIFPKYFHKKSVQIALAYSVGMTALTLVLPMPILTQLIYAAEAAVMVTGIYHILEVVRILKNREPEAGFIFAGTLAVTVCALYDVLYENNIIRYGYMEYSPFGFLILIALFGCILGIRYDRKHKENRRMLLELRAASERERKMELQFLKSQIRPHFINNALNTVISVSRTDTEKARGLLVAFSKYLRSCYDMISLDDHIPIEHELSLVRSYVLLQQARFRDTLRVRYDIDPVAVKIPPLTLQPLVENAIVHGVRGIEGMWDVLVYVKKSGEHIRIGVQDNGKGFDPMRIDALLWHERTLDCVGIYNVNQRVKRMYHTQLCIENRPEGGANVFFWAPLQGEC